MMSLECPSKRTEGPRSEMGSDPRFGSGVVFQGLRPLFSWSLTQSETKRVFSGASLGNPRASPPRIRLQTGGTRSISMVCEYRHFDRRQFFWRIRSPVALLKTTPNPRPRPRPFTPRATYRSNSPFKEICLALRCLTKKCLTVQKYLDKQSGDYLSSRVIKPDNHVANSPSPSAPLARSSIARTPSKGSGRSP